MNKHDYQNTVTTQIQDLKTLAQIQADKCFDLARLSTVLEPSLARDLKRVVITGCGDSYSAAGAMQEGFRLCSGLRFVSVPDPMDFCRYYEKAEVNKGYPDEQSLVVAVSASGGSARIVEMMAKANRMGALSMLITNNPGSNGAKEARLVFDVQTPPGCNTPGLRSYYASMIAITALGAYIGVQQNHISQDRFFQIKEEMVSYTLMVLEQFEGVDDQMFACGMKWKDLEKFEVIGDGYEGFSGQFVEEKFIECAGVHTTHADSEDWCHINFFLREPETIGTIFMTQTNDPSFDRVLFSIRSSVGVGRPTLVVTDGTPEVFPEGAEVCRIPRAPEAWMAPVADFIPGSLLGGYVAACAGKLFFGGKYDFRTQTWDMNA